MTILWFLGAAAVLCGIAVLISYLCFRMAFYSAPRSAEQSDTIETPEGEIYDAVRPDMERWARETRALPQERMSVMSFDGLKLWGTYYEFAPGAPIELMFHGYRGSSERDLSGGVQRCFALGRSALMVEQRSSGRSEGNVITFGIREHRDCLTWLNYVLERFGPDVKVILTGISMGASTVMMVADKDLPSNVLGILADCGYTSPRDIIREVIRQMGLPVGISYPFVKLGAKLFGGFDLEAGSPQESLKNSTVPVIFIHGEDDDFVPCDMSRENWRVCASRKRLLTVPGAGHGLGYPMARDAYFAAVREFFGEEASANEKTDLRYCDEGLRPGTAE